MSEAIAEIPADALFVVGLQVRNVMGVRAVALEFDPNGELVLIGGENAQGKSSTLIGLESAIAGAAALPPDALRHGAGKGGVVVVLSDREGVPRYKVERFLTQGGGTRLEVHSLAGEEDGGPVRSPQGLLAGFLSAIGFDPLEFASLAKKDPQKAAESLRKLVGVEFKDLDEREAKATEERKTARRELDTIEKQIAGLPPLHKDAPNAEQSVAELTAQFEAAQAEVARRAAVRVAASEARAAVDAVRAERVEAEAEVERLEAELLEARAFVQALHERVDAASNVALEAIGAESALDELVDAGVDAARAALAGADEANRKVRENALRKMREAERAEKKRAFDDAQADLETFTDERRARIAGATYPIEGLAFDPTGTKVLLHGVPFEQASDAERVRVSLAVGMALNPRLRALIIGRSGNDLDKRAIATLREHAKEHRFLIIGERVGDGSEVSVVIEDGQVLEDRRAV